MFDINPREIALKILIATTVFILIFTILNYVFKPKSPVYYYEIKFTNGEIIKDSLRENWRSLGTDNISYQKSSMIYYKRIKTE